MPPRKRTKKRVKLTATTNGTSDRLLDAAEAVFARNGYDAASIRMITKEARVQLALAHYHFKSKPELFRRVLIRRVDELRSRRLAMLENFKKRSNGGPVSITEIVQAFAEPAFYLSMHGGPGWKNYMKLNAQISIAAKYVSMVGDIYDPTAEVFLRELSRTLPNATVAATSWGYLFLVAATAAALSESGRIEMLSKQKLQSSQLEQAYTQAKIVMSAGLQALNGSDPIS